MSLANAIERAFEKKLRTGWNKWPKMYWAIDLHDVMIPGTYTRNNDGRMLFPNAVEVLQWLTKRPDMAIILFTSSHEDAIKDILLWLEPQGIKFDFVNENPECVGHHLCDFSDKFYFDVMLEDKAGFNGMEDWLVIKETLVKIGEWDKKIHK